MNNEGFFRSVRAKKTFIVHFGPMLLVKPDDAAGAGRGRFQGATSTAHDGSTHRSATRPPGPPETSQAARAVLWLSRAACATQNFRNEGAGAMVTGSARRLRRPFGACQENSGSRYFRARLQPGGEGRRADAVCTLVVSEPGSARHRTGSGPPARRHHPRRPCCLCAAPDFAKLPPRIAAWW